MPTTRFNWWLPLYAALCALILFVPLMAYGGDMLEFLYVVFVVPIVSIFLLVFAIIAAIRKNFLRALETLLMLVVYCVISWSLFRNSFELRTFTRWLFWSKDYKAQILAEPDPADGLLKHIEWDGWGYPGVGDTVAYLVFDPNDLLLTVKLNGLPCKVWRVRRLESHYYTVLFYTDTDWNRCR